MAKAVTGPGRTVFGKPGGKGSSGSDMGAPKKVGYRVHPTPHAQAAKARTAKAPTTKSALAVFPRKPSNIATSGNPS